MIKVRQRTDTKEPAWQVDIKAMPPGELKARRYRYSAPRSITSKSGALRWGEQTRRQIEAGDAPSKSKEGREAAAQAVEEAKPPAPKVLTLRDAAEIYLADSAGRGNCGSTINMKRDRLKRVLAVIGDTPLVTAGEAEASTLRASLRSAGLIASTINGILETLQAAIERCHALGYRPTPAPRLERVRERRVRAAKAYDDGVFELIVQVAQKVGPEHLALVLVCGEAGLRVGELRGLEIRDVDAVRGILHVERSVGFNNEVGPTKNGEARDVPMTPRLAGVLAGFTAGREASEPIFLTDDGDRLTRSAVAVRLRKVLRAAGLPMKGVHTLRHTCASSALAGGADMVAVQKMLGHRDLQTTVGAYLHDTGTAPSRAVSALVSARKDVVAAVTDLSRVPRAAPRPSKGARKH